MEKQAKGEKPQCDRILLQLSSHSFTWLLFTRVCVNLSMFFMSIIYRRPRTFGLLLFRCCFSHFFLDFVHFCSFQVFKIWPHIWVHRGIHACRFHSLSIRFFFLFSLLKFMPCMHIGGDIYIFSLLFPFVFTFLVCGETRFRSARTKGRSSRTFSRQRFYKRLVLHYIGFILNTVLMQHFPRRSASTSIPKRTTTKTVHRLCITCIKVYAVRG